MAKNDYFVVIYRILIYLYGCMKAGVKPSLEYLHYDTDQFPVNEAYWNTILTDLVEQGYIRNVPLVPVIGNTHKLARLTEDVMITPAGIEFLNDNSTIEKAKQFLKDIKAIVPGM